jgi:hypothetical protein
MPNGHSVTRALKLRILRRGGVAASCWAASLLLVGCSRAPTFNLLGSVFPAWIVCGVIGILLTLAVRLFFIRIKLDQQLKPLVVVYVCLAALFTFTLWLLFFR